MRSAKAFQHEVVDDRAQLEAALLGDLVHAVGEHHDDRLALEIDPERGAGEAEVPDRARREVAGPTRTAPASACPSRAPSPSPSAAAGAREGCAAPRAAARRCGRARRRARVCAKRITSSARARTGPRGRRRRPSPHAFGSCTSPQTMPLAPRAVLGRGDAPAQRLGGPAPSPTGTKNVSRMPSGAKMRSRQKSSSGWPRHRLDHRAEHDEVEIAVDGGARRARARAPSADALEHPARAPRASPSQRSPVLRSRSSSSSWKPRQGCSPEECVSRWRSVTRFLVALGERGQVLRDRRRRGRARRRATSSSTRASWWRSAW